MRSRTADIGLALSALLVTAVLFGYTYTFSPPVLPGTPGASLFPRFSLLIIGISAIGIGITSLRSKLQRPENEEKLDLRFGRLVLFGIVGAGYAAALVPAGFEVATFTALGISLFMSTRRAVTSIVLAAGGTVFLYIMFVLLLKVNAPTLFLPQYLSQILRF